MSPFCEPNTSTKAEKHTNVVRLVKNVGDVQVSAHLTALWSPAGCRTHNDSCPVRCLEV